MHNSAFIGDNEVSTKKFGTINGGVELHETIRNNEKNAQYQQQVIYRIFEFQSIF